MDKQKTICLAIAILLIFAGILGLVLVKGGTVSDGVFCIYSDGKLIRTVDPDECGELTFEVKSENGGSNVIQVSNGKIGVISADCPDRICVDTPHISDGIQPIVCMPNHLVIQIEARKPDIQ